MKSSYHFGLFLALSYHGSYRRQFAPLVPPRTTLVPASYRLVPELWNDTLVPSHRLPISKRGGASVRELVTRLKIGVREL